MGISKPERCPKRDQEVLPCRFRPCSCDERSQTWTVSGLLLQIFRLGRPRTARTQNIIPSQVNQAILTESLTVDYTAKELAAQFGVSETSLKTYFMGVYGENISVYLRKKRMEHAAHLLETTQLKISEIALQSGYDNQSKFAAVFKKEYQTTPLEYRRVKWLLICCLYRSRNRSHSKGSEHTEKEVIMVRLEDCSVEALRELAFTEEELAELERARSMPITFDEDCPEITPEQALRLRRVNPVRKAEERH